ncbi:hypothetical protein M422DRAFT_254593 [Sphaerobolus stellatus SS14]|uniref:Uncharacterized protein n=1 Tax=Sphaerobolus stellatus (strain SS14) TaxID=990650 RepID=A0A0C9UGK6_SPHS4|nr:hypothetical protein M422DRAFT_254593 [Sphaerobolus stellatus SS14]
MEEILVTSTITKSLLYVATATATATATVNSTLTSSQQGIIYPPPSPYLIVSTSLQTHRHGRETGSNCEHDHECIVPLQMQRKLYTFLSLITPGSSCRGAQSGRPTLCPRRKAKAKRRTSAPGNDVSNSASDERDEHYGFSQGIYVLCTWLILKCGKRTLKFEKPQSTERTMKMSFYRILDMAQPMTALDDDVHELKLDTASQLPDGASNAIKAIKETKPAAAPPNTSVVSSVPHSSRPVIVNRILNCTSSDGDIEEAIVAPVRKRKPPGEPVEQDRHAVKKPKVAGEGTVTVDTEMIADDEKRNVGAVPKKRIEPLQSDEAV